jgi:hypothetical protein
MITYEKLRQWRDLCEFLSQQWYKCADCDELEKSLPNCQGWKAIGQSQRRQLWEWQIQLIQWGSHPAIRYSNSAYRKFKKWKGWTLKQDWEIKIDFLEKIVLLNADPDQLDKPWQVAIAKAREEKIRLEAIQEQRLREQTRIGEIGYEAWQKELTRQARLSYREIEAERQAGVELIMEEMLEEERQKIAKRANRFAQGLCQWCGVPMVTLMRDCPSCRKGYE